MIESIVGTFIAFNLVLAECLLMFGYYKKKKIKASKKVSK